MMAELEYITAPLAALRSEPDEHGLLISELLHGEQVEVLKRHKDWALVENVMDRHTGYVRADTIGAGDEPTHLVKTLGSFLYREPSLKSPAMERLSFFSRVAVQDVEGDYAKTPHGYLHNLTLESIEAFRADPVETARRFIGVPYLWGGRSSTGLDCSSLVQLAFAADGVMLPKNAGPQRKVLQTDTTYEQLEPGDLLFVPGHVMISTKPGIVIYADGVGMTVAELPLERALVERGFTMDDLILKKRPTSDEPAQALLQLRNQLGSGRNPIDRDAFLGLSGPEIMS